MAKLTVVAAVLFAALITVASATSYTTVVTTTVDGEGNPEQSCQSEVQRVQMMHCMQWMQSQTGRSPYEGSFLRSAVANPRYQEEEHLQECCDELRSVSKPCRCEAMRHMMKQMQQQYGMEEEMQTMKERMQSLPQMCNMKSPTRCRFPVVFV